MVPVLMGMSRVSTVVLLKKCIRCFTDSSFTTLASEEKCFGPRCISEDVITQFDHDENCVQNPELEFGLVVASPSWEKNIPSWMVSEFRLMFVAALS